MNSFVDTVINGTPKYMITHADTTTEEVEIDLLNVDTVGTALNKLYFDSIEDDINSRLLIADKASQAEAVAGTDDTKYMTPLKTAQQVDVSKGVKLTNLVLSTTDVTTIDLTPYLTNNVEKLEIVVNANFSISYHRAITINGTNIINNNTGGSSGTKVSSINVGGYSTVDNALLKIEIYPENNFFKCIGVVTSSGTQNIEQYATFESLASIVLGRLDHRQTPDPTVIINNYDYQVGIYQYLK